MASKIGPRWPHWFRRGLTRGPPMTPQSTRRNTWISFCKPLPAAPCWSDEVPPPSTNHRSGDVYLTRNMQRVSRSAVGVGCALQAKIFTQHDRRLKSHGITRGGDIEIVAAVVNLKIKRLAPCIHQPELRHAGSKVGGRQTQSIFFLRALAHDFDD